MSERRLYETTFIVNAALEDNDIELVITKVMNHINNNSGSIQEINKWGRKRLAYPIAKKHNGFYVNVIYQSMPEFIPPLERFLTLDDTILRHLTLQITQQLLDLRAKRAMEEGQAMIVEQEKVKEETKTETVEVVASKEAE
jgi:small subunit ribosomal protein S6